MGGVLNLSLGSTMTTEECLEIVKKLEGISQNKFYNINIWDTGYAKYLGDCELFYTTQDHYTLLNAFINNDEELVRIKYVFYMDGRYYREVSNYGSLSDILTRLEDIEKKLNEITTK